MKSTGQHIIEFYSQLDLPLLKEPGVHVMNPFKNQEVQQICDAFYNRFYNDNGKRTFLIAINPGRFGAGITGLPFTDPLVLQDVLGISNSFQKRKELSAIFIYELIEALGGLDIFYSKFFFSNVSPLGFVKDGKNLNYYDISSLQSELTPWIIKQMNLQVEKWGRRDVAYTIGKGKNHKVLMELNKSQQWFEKIIALPHPRWVMQYNLKHKDSIIDEIIKKITR